MLQWVGVDVPLFGRHKRRLGHPYSRLEHQSRLEVQSLSLSLCLSPSPQAVLASVQLEGSKPSASLLRTEQPQGGPYAAFTMPYSGPQPSKRQLVGEEPEAVLTGGAGLGGEQGEAGPADRPDVAANDLADAGPAGDPTGREPEGRLPNEVDLVEATMWDHGFYTGGPPGRAAMGSAGSSGETCTRRCKYYFNCSTQPSKQASQLELGLALYLVVSHPLLSVTPCKSQTE